MNGAELYRIPSERVSLHLRFSCLYSSFATQSSEESINTQEQPTPCPALQTMLLVDCCPWKFKVAVVVYLITENDADRMNN